MAGVSRYGVWYDLRHSPHYVDYLGYRFYFSTSQHRISFMSKARTRCDWLSDSFQKRFHFKVDAGLIAVFQLYMLVEGRGFYVVSLGDGEEYTAPSQLHIEAVVM